MQAAAAAAANTPGVNRCMRAALTCAMLPCSELEGMDPGRAGILVGSAMGGMATFASGAEAIIESYRKMNPFCVPFAITNMGSAMLAMDTGFMGPNYSISTACATGNYCMLNAMGHIQRGDADVMLAGASDAAIIPAGIGGFVACKALSRRNDAPAAASRPWDKGRDGFVMGEGAGVLVLEDAEHAARRGARVYAELLGGATNCDAHHITEPRPDGAGVQACVELALERAGVRASDVGYVNAHGTSTQAGDMAEYRAITRALAGSGCDSRSVGLF
jgi:3-oxoacyl-[acyl-carrier-protein] synthase II